MRTLAQIWNSGVYLQHGTKALDTSVDPTRVQGRSWLVCRSDRRWRHCGKCWGFWLSSRGPGLDCQKILGLFQSAPEMSVPRNSKLKGVVPESEITLPNGRLRIR